MVSIFERVYKFFLVWTLSIFLSAFAGLGLLFAYIVHFYKTPWRTKDRMLVEIPDCLNDPKYGKHKYVTIKKVRLHYVESGDPSKPLLLFVHGVPEFWWSWRNQIVEFNKDYWVVALDQRGFNLSDKPVGKHHYKVENAVSDIKALLQHLNRKKCIYVGHDWGAFVGWEFVAKHGNMVYKYAMFGGPSPKVYYKMVLNSWDQFKRSWYFFVFKMPYLPEKLFAAGDYGALFAMWDNKFSKNFTENDLETLKFVNSKSGALTAQLNYYRANSTFVRDSAEDIDDGGNNGMFVLGQNELYISHESVIAMSNEYPKLRVEIIPGANHFVHQDAPNETNALLRNFLGLASNYKVETFE